MSSQCSMKYQILGAKFTNCIICMCQNTKKQKKNPQKQTKQNNTSQPDEMVVGEMKINIIEIIPLIGLYQISEVSLTLVGTTT